MFLIVSVVCIIMLIEKCAKGRLEFYDVQGMADVFKCVPVFLLFRRTATPQTNSTHRERSWALCLSVKKSFILLSTTVVKVEIMRSA